MADQILMYMPVWGILLNTTTQRYHPILFRGAPLPGNNDAGRYQSHGHHITGLDTREEAIESITTTTKKIAGGARHYAALIAWDGEDMPAMTILIPDSELKDSIESTITPK